MAGDWIKMRCNLWDDPRVAKLCDLTDCAEAAIVGGLYWLWSAADQHSEDGLMPGLTRKSIDRKTGIKGFGDALEDIGWVSFSDDGACIVRFDEHNGASAKKRCQTAKRVAAFKAGNAEVTLPALPEQDECVSDALPREREEKSKPHSEDTTSTTIPVSVDKTGESLSSSDFDERAKSLADRLSKRESSRVGKPVVSSRRDPRVIAWAKAGVTDSQFAEAYDMALTQRESEQSGQPVNVGFLDAFIAKVIGGDGSRQSAIASVPIKPVKRCCGFDATGDPCSREPVGEVSGRPWCREHREWAFDSANFRRQA